MDIRYLSISQLSQVTGRDRRTVTSRLSALKPYKIFGKSHIYDAHTALEAIYKVDSIDEIETQMAKASLRIEEGNAEKIDLQLAKMRGDQVEIETVAAIVEKEYGRVRAQHIAIANKTCRDLAVMTDPRLIKDFIEDAINESLSELTADEDFKNYEIPELNINDQGEANAGAISVTTTPLA